MNATPTVRVGVVSYNVAEHLAQCLAALPDALDGLPADVVVVDNASADDSAAVAAGHGVTVVQNPTNVGYARAMNAALEDSDADVLVALNPDTVPRPGSLRRLVAVLEQHPEVAVAAPRLVTPDGRTQHSAHPFPWLPQMLVALLVPHRWVPSFVRRRLLLGGTLTADRTGPVDWAIGAVHAMRRSVVGDRPYGERWFMYVEDVDLCWRMRQAGHTTWFVGDATVVHEGSASAVQVFGPDPSERWWGETYDWYARERGSVRCRLYALLNAGAAARRWAASRRHDPRASAQWRHRAQGHLVVVREGPPPPAEPPAGGSREEADP